MLYVLMAVLSLHVLSAVFWTGTSFALARTGGLGGARLFRPQMGAALVAVITGAYLGSQLHAGGFGTPEFVLAIGAACAVAAAGVQGRFGGMAMRALRQGRITDAQVQPRIATGQRIASPLLAVTLICMVISRYV
jgi:uncharacterized membrane protein